ncbi:MAG: cystathionine gamma-synthase [bacterium]|nr:cystathionine gamma-synthase [bacterium]
MRVETKAVHTGVNIDGSYNSVITPIYPSSTFMFDEIGKNRGFDYTRSGNPTRSALADNICALEGGTAAWITCTGMAAITTTLFIFKPGDHIITGDDIYGGTYRLFFDVFTRMGLRFSFVNMRDEAAIRAAITPETKAVWIETPSNPLLNLVDVAAVTKIAREHDLVSIADNTFLSPCLFNPFEHGVDVIVHSTTKYINGHSDVVGGAIVVRNDKHAETISYYVNALGTGASPFDSWLVLRGIKTMPQRMEAHMRGAMAVARFLESCPRVKRVYYPGLESHPQHELAKRQFRGFGGMVSFDLDVDQLTPQEFFSKLKLFVLAESLGGVESLIEQPWTMSHASMPEEARIQAGLSQGTVRISIGIEHPDDLVEDLKNALA